MSQMIQIKGIREGLLVTLGDQPWDEVHQALLEHLDQQGEFLRGARLALDVGNHVLKAADLGHLSKEICRARAYSVGGDQHLAHHRALGAVLWAGHTLLQAATRAGCHPKARGDGVRGRTMASWYTGPCALAPACSMRDMWW